MGFCEADFSSTYGKIKFDLYDGKDLVYLYRVKVDDLNANLYGGCDYFSMVLSYIGLMNELIIDGGSGSDGLNLFKNNRSVWYPGASGIEGFSG